MIKPLCLALSLIALAGCTPDAPKNAGGEGKTTISSTERGSKTPIPPDGKLPPAPALSINTSFSSPDFCRKAGYDTKQCDQAYSVAFAMHNADSPKYATLKECSAVFSGCELDAGSKKIRPKMAGFSVAGQEKGTFSAASKDKPLYLLPLYKTPSGKLAEIKNYSTGIILLPVGEKMTAKMINPSGLTVEKSPQKSASVKAK